MAIKAILFDFWGTLVENGVFPSPVRQAKRLLGLESTSFSMFIITFEKAIMTREYDDLYKAFSAVAEDFNITLNQNQLDLLVGMWNKNKMLAKPYAETISELKRLKENYKILLISNTDCFSVKSVIEKYNLDELFDGKYLSYEMGMLKSNPKMYDTILEKEGLSKDEVIMVGDSMESDVLSAENAGIRGVLIDRNERREHHSRIKSLAEIDKYL